MRRALLTTVGAVAAVAAALVVVPTASASDTRCTGPDPLTGRFDNLVVPENTTCVLVGSVVLGNVKVLANARLLADSNDIRGNVEGDRAALVTITDRPDPPAPSIVGGNIQAKEGNEGVLICGTELPGGDVQVEKLSGSDSYVLIGDAFRCGSLGGGNSLAKGSLKVEENRIGTALGIGGNRVGQNLQVAKNTGAGTKTVIGNTGGGDLHCADNSQPFTGRSNTFPAEAGQCS